MATLPDGITKCTVTFGKRYAVLGTEATINATVQLDRPLVWAATGDMLDEWPEPVASGAGGFLTFSFPHTDQAGFLDVSGNAITDFAGVLRAVVSYAGKDHVVVTKPFQIPTGVDNLDLDLVPGGSITLPVVAPQPKVTSVAGLTNAVTSEDLAGALGGTSGTLAAKVDVDPVRAAATLHLNNKLAAQRGKGGVVGTGGKAAVSFRIDHGVQQWLDVIWPMFKARGIPASLGVVTSAIGNPAFSYEGTSYTWAQLRAEARKGFEVWCHTATHGVPATATRQAYYDAAIAPKAVIESNGLKCIGYQQPGAGGSPNTIPDWSGNWVPGTSWNSELGQQLMAAYGLIEINGEGGGALRQLPAQDNDLGWYTLDSNTLAGMKVRIDQAIQYGWAVKFMLHPAFIVGNGYPFKESDVAALLDYVKEKVDGGQLVALTASGFQFADRSANRLDLMWDNDFATAAGAGAPWTTSTAAVGFTTFGTDGGRTYAQISSGGGTGYLSQANQQVVSLGANGQTFMAEIEARAVGANQQVGLTLLDETNPSELNFTTYFDQTAGGPWKIYRQPVTIPKETTRVVVRARRGTGSGDMQVRGVRLRPC